MYINTLNHKRTYTHPHRYAYTHIHTKKPTHTFSKHSRGEQAIGAALEHQLARQRHLGLQLWKIEH